MKLNKTVELLAPAKDKETAIAAINSGADAIYIGAVRFGARQNASNSIDDIKEIVDYAHRFNVRVHVTLNTILSYEELREAEKLINELYQIGVDAIIVQDTGIFELAIEGKLPPIELHASTQCNNRTLEKVKFFQKMGVKRVILARELTLGEIENICQEVRKSDFNPDMEIEVFIHGALCVSYSGQCYLSASIGGRSANRGECAQPCRKKYTLVDEDGNVYAKDKYLLNLKDFNASKHIERLINVGVKSFKIEGRLETFNSQVYATESRINEETHTLTVRALYPNRNGELLPGRYADIALKQQEIQDAIAIPSEAIVPEMGKNKVFLYRSGVAEPVDVEIGIRTEAEVQVLKGLSAGDTILTSGTLQLRTGMPVILDQIN